MRINIPGLESIDINEIIENAPRPVGRRTNFKPRPTRSDTNESPKMPSEAELSKALKELSEQIQSRPSSGIPPVLGSIPGAGGIETINIPGVGPIQLPMPQSPTTTEPDSGKFEDTIVFGPKIDPNASELDKLKAQYDHLSGIRFFRDPGPEHWNKIKELAQQIYALDNTFESPYLETPEQVQMKKPRPGDDDIIYDENPVIGTRPDGTPVRLYDKDSADYLDKQKTNQSPVFDENESTRTGPIETKTETETKSGEGPKPGTGVADGPVLKPFEGYIPPNIIGTSFDPKELSRHKKKVDKAKARRKPGKPLIFKNPILGTQQTQFGGYGQPMPTAPLMDYAGLASPITYSTPDPDPDKEIIR